MTALLDAAFLKDNDSELFTEDPVYIGREIVGQQVEVAIFSSVMLDQHGIRIYFFSVYLKIYLFDAAKRQAPVIVDFDVHTVTYFLTVLPYAAASLIGQNVFVVHSVTPSFTSMSC